MVIYVLLFYCQYFIFILKTIYTSMNASQGFSRVCTDMEFEKCFNAIKYQQKQRSHGYVIHEGVLQHAWSSFSRG